MTKEVRAYLIVVAILLILMLANIAKAQIIQPANINMEAIEHIESSGNPMAHNKRDNSRGLFQISPICLTEYNRLNANNYSLDDLWDPFINREIALWYITKRIPQMLRYYKKDITVSNIIIAYNAGISYVAHDKSIPSTTKIYLEKYRRLTK